MKQKITWLSLLFIAVTQLNNFSYGQRIKLPEPFPLIAEDGIYSITVSENVDVYLMQDKPENISVKATDNVLDKLSISLVKGNLVLAAKNNLAADERLTVYVWVSDLENLVLKGNALAVSRGILQSKNLHISASTEAEVSIKSKGKVWFDTPQNYQVVNEREYFFVNSSIPAQK